jgi:pimeloyl-ACP methyl ester carboxylesterase
MTTWVFLRGLTRESAHWGDFPRVFQQSMPQARIHLLDLPGNGLRFRERSPSSVTDMVLACRENLARIHQGARVHLLAMSLGAMVATEWARTAPGELSACVLINTSFKPLSPFYDRLLARNYPTLLRLAMGHMTDEDAERAVLRITCNHPGRQPAIADQWAGIRRQRPVRPGNAWRQLLAAARFRAPLVAPPVPTLLLCSEHDQLVSHHCSRVIARTWDCPLLSHPSAGHDLPQDDPWWVARGVCEWLNPAPRKTHRDLPS